MDHKPKAQRPDSRPSARAPREAGPRNCGKDKDGRQAWFCVEDCSDPTRPLLLLSEGTLQDCHDFIERCRLQRRPGVYRVNYSLAMRKYFASRRAAA